MVVLVGYAKDSPSYRVWNPLKAKKVANVGGAKFDESVAKAWWRGGLGVEDLADMEVVIFPDAKGNGDAPADRVGGGAPRARVEASRLEGMGHPIQAYQWMRWGIWRKLRRKRMTPLCLACWSGMRRTGLTVTRAVTMRKMKRRREGEEKEIPPL